MAEGGTSGDAPADVALIARLEALARRAWPALEERDIDGWIVATSGAYTRRANCVSPVAGGRLPVSERVARVEAELARIARPVVFKLHPATNPRDLDAHLEARGYLRRSETIVMTRETVDLDGASPDELQDERGVRVVAGRLDDDWLEASLRLSSVGPQRRDDYRAILERALATTDAVLFGRLECDGGTRSVALASVVEASVSFFQVATDPALRGRRLAERVLARLLEDARQQGARLALLSVEADNAPARRLYERLGFVERYRYWYRESAAG